MRASAARRVRVHPSATSSSSTRSRPASARPRRSWAFGTRPRPRQPPKPSTGGSSELPSPQPDEPGAARSGAARQRAPEASSRTRTSARPARVAPTPDARHRAVDDAERHVDHPASPTRRVGATPGWCGALRTRGHPTRSTPKPAGAACRPRARAPSRQRTTRGKEVVAAAATPTRPAWPARRRACQRRFAAVGRGLRGG